VVLTVAALALVSVEAFRAAPAPSIAAQPVAVPAAPATHTAVPAPASRPAMLAMLDAATQTPLPVAPEPTSNVLPTPTPRPADTPPRVGLQVGHWLSNELPDELARLRGSTGAFFQGRSEMALNLDIARRVEKMLAARGISVDVLPATVPPGYDADAFVAIHADGANGSRARGFKLATPWRTSTASRLLMEAVDDAYGKATGLPRDGSITINMRGYYAFNYRRHEHAIARTTPAVIVEMGFITNAADRDVLYGRADVVAAGIANGVIRYLNTRDVNDGAALLPPDFPGFKVAGPDPIAVRRAPRDNAEVLARIDASTRLMAFQEREGWLEVFVRGGNGRVIGWVRRDQLAVTNEPPPTPPPASDS
jgi:N-acetylmuramoyl-L-alanine amidase